MTTPTLPDQIRLQALRAAWAKVAPAFVIHERPSPLTAAQVDAQAREWLAGVFPGRTVSLALPADLVWWIEEVACFSWADRLDDPWINLFPSPWIVGASEDARYVSDPPENEVPWLAIGCWSDHHTWLVCCDPTDPRFGEVCDYNDFHPWLKGDLPPDNVAADMLVFVRSLRRG